MRTIACLIAWLGGVGVATAGLAERTWTVDGQARTGLVYTPDAPAAATRPAGKRPAVFVFHGHGGNPRNGRRTFQIDTHWPDAVVVYLQGLPTPGMLSDPDGERPGWDAKNTADANRDLKLFDAVLADLLAHDDADPARVYATGHSNGGGFTFLLWACRGDKLAAVAPTGSIAAVAARAKLTPKPALLVSGTGDTLVKFAWQQRMIDRVKRLNTAGDGTPWGKDGTWHSHAKTPLATIVYDGGHALPTGIGERVVAFFKTIETPPR